MKEVTREKYWEIYQNADFESVGDDFVEKMWQFIEQLLKQQKADIINSLKLECRHITDPSWFTNSFDDCRRLGHEEGWNEAVDDLNNKREEL